MREINQKTKEIRKIQLSAAYQKDREGPENEVNHLRTAIGPSLGRNPGRSLSALVHQRDTWAAP